MPHDGPVMNASARLAVSLIVALVLCAPSLLACLHGNTDIVSVAIRYLIALTLLRLALGAICQLADRYRASGDDDAEAEDDGPKRRASDRTPVDAG
jgi:hypothetical protein